MVNQSIDIKKDADEISQIKEKFSLPPKDSIDNHDEIKPNSIESNKKSLEFQCGICNKEVSKKEFSLLQKDGMKVKGICQKCNSKLWIKIFISLVLVFVCIVNLVILYYF